MAHNLHAVDKDAGAVGGGTKADLDLLAGPFAGDKEVGLIPEITAVFAAVLVGEDIAEGGGDRHTDGVRQTGGPVGLHTLALGVKRKLPHTVQAHHAAGRGNAGIEKRFVFHGNYLLWLVGGSVVRRRRGAGALFDCLYYRIKFQGTLVEFLGKSEINEGK